MLNRIWRAAVASGLVLVVTAHIVSAHAELVKASPAPNSVVTPAPSQVMLWFDEPVGLAFSSIEVLDSQRGRVDNGDLALAPGDPKQLDISLKPLANGTYTVVWQALSAADGHVTRGTYAFGVGSATGAALGTAESTSGGIDQSGSLAIAVRALELWSILALVGALFFRDLLLDRSLRAIGMDESVLWANEKSRQLAVGAIMLALIGEVLRLALESSLLTNAITPQGMGQVLFETRLGALWLIRFVILAPIGCLILWFPPRETVQFLPIRSVLYILSLGALVTLSLSSHGSAQGDLSIAVFADWLHLTAVSLWVGGLAAFLWVIAPVWRLLPADKRPAWLAALIPQFSLIALTSVVVIALTGLYSALLNVGSWDALLGTLYGEILASKVAVFILMLPLAAINLFVMRRAFSSAGSEETNARRYRVFRNLVAGEVAAGIVVIALAGYLTLTPPARGALLAEKVSTPAPHVFLVAHPSPDLNIALTVTPPAGPNQTFAVTVTNAANQPVADVLRVIFEFTWLEQDAGSTRVNVDNPEDGRYRVSGSYMPLPGMWRLQVIVRRRGVEDTTATFPFFQTANATPALVNDPSALDLLRRSDAAMNKLKTLRSIQFLNDGENGSVTTNYEYQAPDRLYFQVIGQGESIAIGGRQYYRDKGQQTWTERPRVDPFVFPNFDNATQAQGVKLGRLDALDGVSTQIVEASTPLGNQQVYYAYWVGTQDLRVRKFFMVAPAHYMVQSYFDYDAPVNIQEPAAK